MWADADFSYPGMRPIPTAVDEPLSEHAPFRDRSQDMQYRANGFTLIEALIVMTVTAILLAIAIPAYSHASAAAHSGAARVELAATVLAAVRHSAIAGTEVVVCPRTGSGQCSGQAIWDGGWMAYADINGNRVRDSNETVLAQVNTLQGGVHLRSTTGRTRLIFQPNGGNAGSNVTFTLCDSRGPEKATTLVLSNAGNLRSGKPTPRAARDCAYGG
jgi:type IV fimbrial biogenesis protein FimT